MSINNIIPNLKIQLKARFRVPLFFDRKESDSNNKNSPELIEIEDLKPKVIKKKNKNKFISTNFNKYVTKTNLLKKYFVNMPFNEMYKKEKDCSIKCDNTIKEMDVYKNYIKLQNLPKIENRKNTSCKNIKILKIKSLVKPIERNNCTDSTFTHAQCQSMPSISSSQKITSYIDILKPIEKINNSNIKNIIKQNKIKMHTIKQNFTIIKGGGIKYNNSIFRNKNMNNLVHYKSFQMII